MHLDLCYTVSNCCTRSSRPQFFGKKGAFKIWQNSKLVFFTKKYRSRLQKETLTQVFSCKFCVISENTIINDHLKTICFCALNLEATLRICSEKCLFWINVSNFRKLPWVLLWKRNFYQNFGSSFSQTCVALKLILLYCKHSDLVLAKKKSNEKPWGETLKLSKPSLDLLLTMNSRLKHSHWRGNNINCHTNQNLLHVDFPHNKFCVSMNRSASRILRSRSSMPQPLSIQNLENVLSQGICKIFLRLIPGLYCVVREGVRLDTSCTVFRNI